MTAIHAQATARPADLAESLLQSDSHCAMIDNKTRLLLMELRRGLITMLCALEDYMEMERSIARKGYK